MRYLFIGIWHGTDPEIQPHSSEHLLDMADATNQITRHAGREDVPDVILVIGTSERGNPKILHEWQKNNDVLQSEFDASQGKPWTRP